MSNDTFNFLISAFLIILSTLCIYLWPGWIIKKKKKEEQDTLQNKLKLFLSTGTILLNIVSTTYVFQKETNIVMAILLWMISTLSGVILLVDIRVKIIPNMCLFPILALSALNYIIKNDFAGLINGFILMFFACYGILLLTRLLHFTGYFGAGDIKMISVATFLFGTGPGIIGFVLGWVISLILIEGPLLLLKKITLKSMIAYGPFLSIGMMKGILFLYI